MATFDPKTLDFINPVAPNLPLAPDVYGRQYQDQLNNVLRLYFNQLDNALGGLFGPIGGKYLRFPYGAVQRTTNKTFAANTATLVTFDQTDYTNGVTNVTTDGLHVAQAGIYNYQFSVQWANPDTQIHTTYIWLRKNGVDIPGTASKFDVPSKHGTSDGYLISAANFYVDLSANDYVEMWAASDSTQPYMEAYAAQTSPFAMPSIPSVVATLSFVSRLPTT
jgi:hypothetical protein